MDHDKIEVVLVMLKTQLQHDRFMTAPTNRAIEAASDLIRDLRTECDNQATKIADLEEKAEAAPDLIQALGPFVKAAEIIASRPQDYADRIVMIGGLATASDLTKRHFSDLLAILQKVNP